MIWIHDDGLQVVKTEALNNALDVIENWEKSGVIENHCLAAGGREILRILDLSGGGGHEATEKT